MPANYNLPETDNTREYGISQFTGVDFSSELAGVSPNRSPDSLNMTFGKYGSPVKRGGIKKIAQCPATGKVNGIFTLAREGNDVHFVHCGTNLYRWDYYADPARVFDFGDMDFGDFTYNTDPLYPDLRNDMELLDSGMGDTKSMAWQFGEYLYILNNGRYLRVGATGGVVDVANAANVAYVPTVRVGSKPNGSDGQKYEDFNLLSGYVKEEFLSDGTATVYQTTSARIYDVSKVEYLNANGAWITASKSEYGWNTSSTNGKVTFTKAFPKPAAEGEDNVRITYKHATDAQVIANKQYITGCTIGTRWNVYNGDMLVLSGNKKYRNKDFTSAPEDPTYFPDSNIAVVGETDAAISGYCLMDGQLVIFKTDDGESATTYVRGAMLSDSYEITLTTKEAVVGLSAISQFTIAEFMGDPLFLSTKGIFNIAQSATTSSRYATARSSYINRKLLAQDLKNAHICVAGTRLYLFVGSSVYVADKYSIARSESSSHELEWLYWETAPMLVSTAIDGTLTMGDAAGGIYQYRDGKEGADYLDYGEKPIRAYWTTAYVFFDTYSRYKSLKRLYTMILPYSRTSVNIYSKHQGGWSLVDAANVKLFNFLDVDFNDFSFNTDSSAYVVKSRVRQRRTVLVQFRFENNMPEQPFGLLGFRCIYTLNGYAKR